MQIHALRYSEHFSYVSKATENRREDEAEMAGGLAQATQESRLGIRNVAHTDDRRVMTADNLPSLERGAAHCGRGTKLRSI